jgi:hypothetical protein
MRGHPMVLYEDRTSQNFNINVALYRPEPR